MISSKVNTQQRLQDVMDALRNSVQSNGEAHCRKCVSGLQRLMSDNEKTPGNLDRELITFTKTLRFTKMRKGCQGCYPPYYREEY